jgi:enoyl-CoA hydratase/carnithine racemase
MNACQNENNCGNLVKQTSAGANAVIAILHLNRPERANAYDDEMLAALECELQKAATSGFFRAIIITADGDRVFCGGADKEQLKRNRARDGLQLKSREVFDFLAALPLPTIAAINGAAVGGGLELALACDIRVCAPTARFRFPELSLGLTPAAGGMRRLPEIIGHGRAREMILFGRELDAKTALDWGLVAHVGDDFQTVALRFAENVVSQDPMATLLAKRMIESGRSPAQRELEGAIQALLYQRKFT